MKTLIVTPSASQYRIYAAQLERLGVATSHAGDGTDALRHFASAAPELVMLDMALPDFDGIEVARRMRNIEKAGEWSPILFITSPARQENLVQAIAVGGDDFLLTPISEAALAAKIKAMQRIVQMRHSMVAMTRKLDAANQELKRLGTVDGLTGVANRRHFDETFGREWRRSMRQGSELSLVMCDVDHFKPYNDNLGHQAGDDCLIRVASALSATLERGGDTLARYGGEEFAVILPDTNLAGARRVAERLRQRIFDTGLPHPVSPNGRVTLSCGVASAVAMPETEHSSLLRAADSALYAAKAAGRNRVASADCESEAGLEPVMSRPFQY